LKDTYLDRVKDAHPQISK